MAEQEAEIIGAASPTPLDKKRKHENLEPDTPQPPELNADWNGNSESDSIKKAQEEDDSGTKQPRLEDKPDCLATNNRYQLRVDEPEDIGVQPPVDNMDNTTLSEDAQHLPEEALKKVNDEELDAYGHQAEGMQHTSDKNIKLGNAQEEASNGELLGHPDELQDLPADVPRLEVVSSTENQDTCKAKTMSRKMEVPNTKVGVLIGKAGDTIRYLQYNSGARIQITRDADADPYAGTRPVELIGTLENINKAEKLIKNVIAEADAGGSPSLVARGFNTVQAVGAREQIEIQVPNEKVGLIIGKGGETIKNLQTRSGARIQLIPQHLPEGDQSKERIVRVSGDKKQIEMAREMIKEVMDQTVRSSPISSCYNQQAFHPRGPAASQWGSRGPQPAQHTGYDYQQRGPYQSQNTQYPAQAYGNYPPLQLAPRSNYGWEQRPPPTTLQGPPLHGGFNYYGGQGSHAADASKPIHTHSPGPSPAMGQSHAQANYNYGQPQGPDYGQPAPYSQTAPPAQSYGHGVSQPSLYSQSTTHPGYVPQEQHGKPPSYGMPPQAPHAQSYGLPRATQPGNMPYQGPISSTQSYGQTASAQQSYPYASSGQMQQTYPSYGLTPSADGYNHPRPTAASAPGYPQQGGQPVSGHGQIGGQQAPGYAQVGPTIGYGQYPSSQPGYTEQAAPNNSTYGYQGADYPAYSGGTGAAYGAPGVSQHTYSQSALTQLGYDQSIPQSSGYATAPDSQPAPTQPGYDQSIPQSSGYATAPASYV